MTCIETYPEVYYSKEVGKLLNMKPIKPMPPKKPQQPQQPEAPKNDSINPAVALFLFLIFAITMIVVMVKYPSFEIIFTSIVGIGLAFFIMLTKFWDSKIYDQRLEEYNKAVILYPKLKDNYLLDLSKYETLKDKYDRQIEETFKEENLAILRKHNILSWKNNRSKPVFLHYSSDDVIKKGKSEELFANLLIPIFDQVLVDSKIPIGDTFYYPDILIISNHLYIDVEIDEPYVEEDGTPIHYLADNFGIKMSVDSDRNEYLTENGFEVIRFSEEQIYCHPNECIDFILSLIQSIEDGKSICNCSNSLIMPKWDMDQAIKLAYKHHRDSYISSNLLSESFDKVGDAFPLSEMPSLYENCVSAKCVECDQVNRDGETFHSKSICLVMNHGGDMKYIPCTRDSLLKGGDVVDKESIMITPLEIAGEIKFRADGLAIQQ